jgi:hypothetical protein
MPMPDPTGDPGWEDPLFVRRRLKLLLMLTIAALAVAIIAFLVAVRALQRLPEKVGQARANISADTTEIARLPDGSRDVD